MAQKVVMEMLQQRFLSGLQAQCTGLEPVVHIVQVCSSEACFNFACHQGAQMFMACAGFLNPKQAHMRFCAACIS
jgi:hypothetical protein